MRDRSVFILIILVTCLAGAVMMGCSSNALKTDPFGEPSGVIYQLTEQEALDLAHWAVREALPEQKIYKLSQPRIGLFVHEELRPGDVRYARFKATTFIYEVDILLSQGIGPQGEQISGYTYAIKGGGDLKTGPDNLARIAKLLKETFDQTGRAVAVTSASPLKPGPPIISSPPPTQPATGASPPAAAVPAAAAPANSSVKEPEPVPTGDVFENLKKLKELYDQGIITREEFETKKKELLDRI